MKQYMLVILLVASIFQATVGMVMAQEGGWICGSDVASEAVKASFRSVWGNGARQAWMNEAGCGVVLQADWPAYDYTTTVSTASTCGFWDKMKGLCSWEAPDLTNRDQLKRLNADVTQVSQYPVVQATQRVIYPECSLMDKLKLRNGCKF